MTRNEALSCAPETYESDIKVEMGEWATARDGQFMETVGLGPCVGLALYDPASRVGYMAHTCGPEIRTIIELLDAAAMDIATATKIKAWLSGGQLDCEHDVPGEPVYYPTIREDILALLSGFGIQTKNLQVNWVDDLNQMAHICLDSGTGEGNIEIEDVPDYYRLHDYDSYFK
jgi:hypothetical protein